jgi:hypothetical protein
MTCHLNGLFIPCTLSLQIILPVEGQAWAGTKGRTHKSAARAAVHARPEGAMAATPSHQLLLTGKGFWQCTNASAQHHSWACGSPKTGLCHCTPRALTASCSLEGSTLLAL